MEIINGLHSFSGKKPLYLALGNFDGVHRGHQAVIRSAVRQARAAGGSSAALLFDPHPSILLHPQKQFCLLTEIDDRVPLMAELGLDYLFVVPFTTWMASLSPENFILEILCHRFKVSGVSIGVDYSFGCGGAGNEELMQEYGKKLGFAVTVSPMEKAGSTVISSSEIKRLLAGERLTGGPSVELLFLRKGRSSPAGPGKDALSTANLIPVPTWFGQAAALFNRGRRSGKQLHFGVTNVGVKPTFQDDALSVETYILDFTGGLYGREITLTFWSGSGIPKVFLPHRICESRLGRILPGAEDWLNRSLKISTPSWSRCALSGRKICFTFAINCAKIFINMIRGLG